MVLIDSTHIYLKSQCALQIVTVNKMAVVMGRSQPRGHSSSLTSYHDSAETRWEEKLWELLQANGEDMGYRQELPFQKMALPDSQ